jgi:hypothetical protein
MKAVLILLVLIDLTCCKKKQAKNDIESKLYTIETRDSLQKVVDSLNVLIDELWQEKNRLLETTDEKNSLFRKFDKDYMELVLKRERTQMRLAYAKIQCSC